MRIYADHAATSPLMPAAKKAMYEACDLVGNPSSVHKEGRSTRMIIEHARESCAAFFNVAPSQVIFTSGATESCNLGIRALAHDRTDCPRHIDVTPFEHEAVKKSAAHHNGNFGECAATMNPERTRKTGGAAARNCDHEFNGENVLARMIVDNETGIILDDLSEFSGTKANRLFCDAVQGLGKLDFDFNRHDADAMAFSSHKIGGPFGVGLLLVKPQVDLMPLHHGGGQEKGWRSGTENAPAIAGFAAALCELHSEEVLQNFDMIKTQKKKLEAEFKDYGCTIVGDQYERVSTMTNVLTPSQKSNLLMMKLDLEGVAVSAGSACSSGKIAPENPKLEALRYDQGLVQSSIRLSFGWSTRKSDFELLTMLWKKLVTGEL